MGVGEALNLCPQLISSVTQGDHSVSVCIPITKQESTRMAEGLTLLVSIR